jgi:hypothetical protein
VKQIDPYIKDAGIAIPGEDEKYNRFHSPTTGEFASSGGGGAGENDLDPHQTRSDPSDVMLKATQKAATENGLAVRMSTWHSEGSSLSTRTITIEPPGKTSGFAQAVIWRRTESTSFQGSQVVRKYVYTFQQQDISLPKSSQGQGTGGNMIKGLVAGYQAVGVRQIPVHMVTNPGFWNHMAKVHPGVFSMESW